MHVFVTAENEAKCLQMARRTKIFAYFLLIEIAKILNSQKMDKRLLIFFSDGLIGKLFGVFFHFWVVGTVKIFFFFFEKFLLIRFSSVKTLLIYRWPLYFERNAIYSPLLLLEITWY